MEKTIEITAQCFRSASGFSMLLCTARALRKKTLLLYLKVFRIIQLLRRPRCSSSRKIGKILPSGNLVDLCIYFIRHSVDCSLKKMSSTFFHRQIYQVLQNSERLSRCLVDGLYQRERHRRREFTFFSMFFIHFPSR